MAQDILIKLKKKSWKKEFQRASAKFISDRSEIISQLLKYGKDGNYFPIYDLKIVIL